MIREAIIDERSIGTSFILNSMFSHPEKDFEYPVEKEAVECSIRIVDEHLKKVVSTGGFGFLSEVAEETFELLAKKEAKEENSVYLSYQDLISYLEKEYIFENPEEIKRFLVNNEDLIEILFSATDHIREIFGNVPVYLELHHDPEEDWDELFIVIKTNYPAEKAVELESKLFENWFVKVLDKVKGRLNFTEEPL